MPSGSAVCPSAEYQSHSSSFLYTGPWSQACCGNDSQHRAPFFFHGTCTATINTNSRIYNECCSVSCKQDAVLNEAITFLGIDKPLLYYALNLECEEENVMSWISADRKILLPKCWSGMA
ncbi:uncharacterized protein LOC144107799 [Amblyomma americanum]